MALVDLTRHLTFLGPLLRLSLTPFGGASFAGDANSSTSGRQNLYAFIDTTVPRVFTVLSADIAKASPKSPWLFIVKDESGGANTNNIAVVSEGSETFDGAASLLITEDFGEIRIYSNGSNLFGW